MAENFSDCVCRCFLLLHSVSAGFFIMSSTAVSEDRIERIIDYGTVLQGISIGGVDVSGHERPGGKPVDGAPGRAAFGFR